ncbi:uncharacterized protein EAE97_000346 [Botrytis byssoidea]|uniref:Azaphilone pigments biosynthesis cluster protein L N-terminal domain-containing protein n=1 Tax=Botrytis byssoidea TaxID=139641 RepID=A0A9P5IXL5_9HELO|nr:uncharacterized protein EAE97_000346 [Botrytis byssoidea]KAF7955087.1 hypothetical protein EAE97_000346 [Botrytis byssoidea]
MADVLATGSAVVGIIVAAFHSARLLHDDFSAVRDAGETIKPLVDDLNSVVGVLSSLDATAKRSDQVQGVPSEIDNDNFKAAAKNCNKICTAFREKLVKWIRHPSNNKMDWRDRFRVGFLAEKELLEFNRQLVACKGTLTIALQMATFSVALRQTHNTESVIENLNDTNKRINQAGHVVIDRIDNLEYQLQRVTVEEVSIPEEDGSQVLSHSPDGPESQAVLESTNETSQFLPQPSPQEMMDIFEKTWKAALAEVASHRIKIGKVTQASNAKAVVGVHGLKNVNEMNVEIDDVSIGQGAWSLVGVSDGVDLNAFFK